MKVAKVNAKNLKAKVELVQGDMFENIVGKFDIIVSNPPYVERNVIPTLENNSQKSRTSPCAGRRRGRIGFLPCSGKGRPRTSLAKGGAIVLEIGYNQAQEVTQLLSEAFWQHQNVIKDYGNCDGIVVANVK